MPHSPAPDIEMVIRDSRNAITASRRLIAQAVRERDQTRSVIQETRCLIEATRVKLAEGGE